MIGGPTRDVATLPLAAPEAPQATAGTRVRVDGKYFAAGSARFPFRGVTYGTFRPRDDGQPFPSTGRVRSDFDEIAARGFTVVRTYTAPPDDVVALAGERGLRLFAGIFYPDWRYLVGTSLRDRRQVMRAARLVVREAARRYAADDRIVAVTVGNEVPADVVRWAGADVVAAAVQELVDVVREEDPGRLVSYGNYPSSEYLSLPGLDFLTFNVFLEHQTDFRRYLTRLHHLAGDRPLVLGEIGLDAGGDGKSERRQASVIDWQLTVARERGAGGACLFSWTDEWWVGDAAVDDWHFGLTRADRTPRLSLEVAALHNRRTLRDLREDWPSMSVVVCAYNAAETLDECLEHTCRLDYPDLEVLVVDDGSTDTTAEITRRHPGARLLSVPHAGLGVARNEGFRAARGELVTYLDSDAYPSPEWPYMIALGFDAEVVGGVGGPNVPPRNDPPGAHKVAHAPGGPRHVLLTDDRAEHIPGCNMSFRKRVLTEVGGFDPVYTAAGDDVDFCWRVLDRGWEIGFHPAALVWHHRRTGTARYLKQQLGYGRAEALVQARHPDRFTSLGTARWRGRIYDSFALPLGRQRIYRGVFGAAPYQSVYRNGGHTADLLHQAGIPLALAVILTAPLAIFSILLGIPAAAAVALILGLAAYDAARSTPPRGWSESRLGFRLGVATLHMLQPLARSWARVSHSSRARRELPSCSPLTGPVRRAPGRVLVLPAPRSRAETVVALLATLRRAGIAVAPASGWDDHDATLVGSLLVLGRMLTSAHPEGWIQLRVGLRLRWLRIVALAAAASVIALVAWIPAAALAAAGFTDILRGAWRLGPHLRRVISEAAIR